MAREIVKEDLAKISRILQKVVGSSKYTKIERMGGMTNHTYHVLMDNGDDLIVRLPGEGTEEMICRSDEKVSTELACELGIDSELLYFGGDGTKVMRYIEDAVTMTAEKLREKEHIEKVASIFRKLHTCGEDTKVPFEVFEMAANYENIILKNNVALYDDYSHIKQQVMDIKNSIDALGGNKKVPCHNDSLCENWVCGKEGMFLIDWEYAGMNDGMWDLADISIEAEYDKEHDDYLLERYFEREPEVSEKKRFIANKIYLDYLWTLWGLTRVPFDGQEMQDYADKRYIRLKRNIENYKKAEE